jgi:hypothetical protein
MSLWMIYVARTGNVSSEANQDRQNQALEQTRDSVKRCSLVCWLRAAQLDRSANRRPGPFRSSVMRSSLTRVATFVALLLIGVVLHFELSSIATVGSYNWWRSYPRWGLYAAEYMAFAAWLAWGPPTWLHRVASVGLLGLAWMSAGWAAVWVARPEYFAAFGTERLQILTIVPLALFLGTLPLILMRRWCRCAPLSVTALSGTLMQVVCAIVVMGIWGMVIFAHRFRGPHLKWDLLTAALVALVLGAIAAASSPFLAWGFLGRSIRPPYIILAWLPPAPLALLGSRLCGGPGPGGNAVYPTWDSLFIALVAIVSLTMIFLWWRIAGLRLASQSQAEPSVGADSR